jgi:polysaccharide deacetylase family protein (PEP-CTERM system associated)
MLRISYMATAVSLKVTPLRLAHRACVFSIDVEDWFHIMDLPTAPRIEQWSNLPVRVERNLMKLLDTMDAHGVKVTCFFLGWVAERFPALVREAINRGHEVASHGYAHQLVYEMSADAFLRDITRAKSLLEQIGGAAVCGYRAPGFSVTSDTPWFFEKLAQAGYQYDSSIFPAARQHGGLISFTQAPCSVETARGSITEIPISVARLAGKRMCFFGGGYLRLFPLIMIRRKTREVLSDGRPVVFYLHPREIDPDHPRLPMPLIRKFKSYIGLKSTERKLHSLLSEFSFMPFRQLLQGAAQR